MPKILISEYWIQDNGGIVRVYRNGSAYELIAENEKDYVEKAIALQDKKNLIKISGSILRDKALSSPLFDTDSFVKDFEKIMSNLVKDEINKF